MLCVGGKSTTFVFPALTTGKKNILKLLNFKLNSRENKNN